MKVILCEDVEHLGAIGEEVSVTPGYARNFLFPRKLAVALETGSAKQIEHELRIIRRREEGRRNELKDVVTDLESLTVEITAKAGDEGKLFGSVTSLHIAEQLKAMGRAIERRKLKLREPIKSLGDHEIPFQLMPEVGGTLKVTVIGEVMEVTDHEVDQELLDAEEDDRRFEAEERGIDVKAKKREPVEAAAEEPAEASAEETAPEPEAAEAAETPSE